MRAAAVGAIALGLLAVPLLFPNFLVYQFSLVLTYAIAILGLNLLMGFNGQISVAHGVFFAVGGYTTAIFMTRYGMNYLATLPLAAATAALFGFVVGVPALRWQGLPLAFITFGLAVLAPPIALKLEPVTKGAFGMLRRFRQAYDYVSREDRARITELNGTVARLEDEVRRLRRDAP